MNFFSSQVFLESFAKTRFADRRTAIEDFEIDGKSYRMLSVDGRPVTRWPFLDFIEALEERDLPSANPRAWGHIPWALVRAVPAAGGMPSEITEGLQPSPYIDWSAFPTWESFTQHVGQIRGRLISENLKRARKTSTELGELTFSLHDPSDEVFNTGVEWKSARFMETGGKDDFFRENLPLFRRVVARGLLNIATLRAGKTLLATAWTVTHEGRMSYWVTAYDARYSVYSPGRQLLHWMLERSKQSGHREFDFLIGNEDYKWHYASHTRVIGPVGVPPLKERLGKSLRKRTAKALANYPAALDFARKIKKRLDL